jgi:pyruvate/2-oxoglutarate dehydrogenase complex dihydrolipoamide acyltransferase (E2) component
VTQNDKNAMNLIDPFQFRALFQGARSVAVVGNAPCILNYQNGADIDSHDLVVRFNRARTAGMEQTIGSRTDILFVNASNSLAKAPPPDQLCKPRCLVCFVSPQGLKAIDVAPFREWAGNCPVLMSYGPDLIGLPGLPRSKPLTSGTYALFTLLRLFDIERLFVTGFTMFGAVAGGGGKYWNEPVPAAATAHDLDQEGKLFATLLGNFAGQLHATDEVRALAKQHGVDLPGPEIGSANRSRIPFRRRVADGLAWRFIRIGMMLRRAAETK